VRELKHLGQILWPEESLELAELCRRVLLDGADGMRNGEWRNGEPQPRRLLELRDLPTGGTIAEEVPKATVGARRGWS
jgi:hypothetical protein